MEKSPYEPQDDSTASKDAAERRKTFTLPVSGAVELFGPEIDIIGTRDFQRLAHIRQLGTSYVVFRGATHTRFEHSLGALYQAERVVQAVNNNPHGKERVVGAPHRLTRLTALLHDVTHIPFGHTLEDEFGLLQRHDSNAPRFDRFLRDGEIARILRSALPAQEYDELLRILAAKTDDDISALKDPFVADIVANTVNADILDYVPRDLLGCGLPVSIGTRFLDFFVVTSGDVVRRRHRRRMALNLQKRGMPRPDVESEVLKLLSYRYELAERVYFHHAKNAASVMIARAVRGLGLATGDAEFSAKEDANFHTMSDEILLAILERPELADALGLHRSPTPAGGQALASELGGRVRNRELYKIAYLVTRDDLSDSVDDIDSRYGREVTDGDKTKIVQDPRKREQLENELARAAGLKPGEVLIHIPPAKMMRKNADVLVSLSDDTVLTLDEWDSRHSQRVAALNTAHERLWRLTVYVHPDKDHAKPLVQAAAADIFGPASRYEVERSHPYVETVFHELGAKRGWTLEDWPAVQRLAARTTADDMGRDLAATADAIDDAINIARADTPPESD